MAQPKKFVGVDAGVRKYDLLTSLSAYGLAGSKGLASTVMRLNLLITARYNCKADEVRIGHVELAAMWSVSIRTAKRETQRMQKLGLISLKQQGVKGRVSVYRLNHSKITEQTKSTWSRVGTDFEARMSDYAERSSSETTSNVVAFPKPNANSIWGRAQIELSKKDPARFKAWFASLEEVTIHNSCLILKAPSAFSKNYIETRMLGELVYLVSEIDSSINEINIVL